MSVSAVASLPGDLALPLLYIAALWAVGVLIAAAAGVRDGVLLAATGLPVATALAAAVGLVPFGRLADIHGRLSDAEFTVAWAEGQAMTPEQMVAYALEDSTTVASTPRS